MTTNANFQTHSHQWKLWTNITRY